MTLPSEIISGQVLSSRVFNPITDPSRFIKGRNLGKGSQWSQYSQPVSSSAFGPGSLSWKFSLLEEVSFGEGKKCLIVYVCG